MFAVIYIPDFFLQAALRQQPELCTRPVGLLSEPVSNALVIQMTSLARTAGVLEGMTATQALARCPQIVIQGRSPGAEASTHEAFLQCVFVFSPFVESTGQGICTLDLRGLPIARNTASSELAGWSLKFIEAAALLHLRAQVGIARTPDLAWLAARFADPFLAVEDAKVFTSELSVESLEPSSEVHGILKRWGIHTVGQLTTLGREDVTERLGQEALVLFKRASANEIRPLNMALLPEIFTEALEFENEVETLEPVLFILRRFVEQLSRRLELVYLVAGELKLTLTLASGTFCERVLKVPSPTRNVETLFRMLFTHLENLTTESAITALRLEAVPSYVENHQFALFETLLRDPNHFFETLARLSALLGSERVGTPVMQASHRPDDFKIEPVKFKELEEELTSRRGKRRLISENRDACVLRQGLALRRLRPPWPAEVQVENERPTHLNSGKVRGKIVQASGPWRTSGRWWENPWARAEWDVETATGRLCRIYQEGPGWFVDGLFD